MRFAISAVSPGLIALALCFGASTPGQAGFSSPAGSITTIVTPISGGYSWDYRVTLTSGAPIGAIEIPEVQPGYLDVTLDVSLPGGWSGTEISSPAFADPTLKDGATPGAWILLTSDDRSDFIAPGATLDFTLFSTLGGLAPAQASAAYLDLSNGGYPAALIFTVDPSTPTSSVPEPSTWALMILGAAGLLALRRRKHSFRQAPDIRGVGGAVAMKHSTPRVWSAFLVLALLTVATSAHAGNVGARVTVDVTVTPSGAGYDWDYRVTVLNPPGDGAMVGAIEIPEVQLGYLDPSTLPAGWSGAEITSPAFLDPLIKPNAAPAGWILLQTLNLADMITDTAPVDFNLFSTFGGGVQAQVATANPQVIGNNPIFYSGLFVVDPSTPSPVPEPSTWALMGLGALGLIALRRRKRPLAFARA